MDIDALSGSIDITLLKPTATNAEIKAIIEDALKYNFASLCIPPCYVPYAASALSGKRRIGTVIGFPFGYHTKVVKVCEAEEAIRSGANELDMVMNISAFKSGQYELVCEEITDISRINPDATVKVIIESSYLTDEEKVKACELSVKGSAHFVKTSTGFGPGGATIEDVRFLVKAAGGRIKVKASGGIRDLDTAMAMINAGASRIGTSAGVRIIKEFLQRYPK